MWALLLAFVLGIALGFVGSIPATGPLLILVVDAGLRNQRRSGLALAAGGALAESVYVLLAFWGLGRALERHGELLTYGRLASAVLLLVLGVVLLRRRPEATADSPPPRRAAGFVLGFTLVALNPAFLITWSAVAMMLLSAEFLPASLRAAPALAAGAFVGIVLWFAFVMALVHRHRTRFTTTTLTRIVRALGVALITFAAWFAVSAIV